MSGFNTFGTAVAVASTFLPALNEAKNGKGVPLASTLASSIVSSITLNAFANKGFIGALVGQGVLSAVVVGGGALAGAAINQIRTRPKYNMNIAAPWSGGYVPTERASLAMRRGMEAIQGVQSMLGSEASLYAARYGR